MQKEELLLERHFLKMEMRMIMYHFMKETDKDEARKMMTMMNDRAKKIEAINCKLAGIEFRQKFTRKGESN